MTVYCCHICIVFKFVFVFVNKQSLFKIKDYKMPLLYYTLNNVTRHNTTPGLLFQGNYKEEKGNIREEETRVVTHT